MRHPHILRDMALFVEVAKRGSFSRAAAELDMPISSLSRRIMLFEAALGLRLIERTTRKLTLTRHGETYLPRAARLVEEAQRTVEEMLAQAKGASLPIRITLPAEPWIQRAVAGALAEAALPERVTLHVEVSTTEPAQEGFDLAIVMAEPANAAVDIRALPDLRVGLYASRVYLDRRGAPAEPHDLERHEAILVARRQSADWRLVRGEQSSAVRVTGRVSCTSTDLARRLAVGGRGIVAAGTAEIANDLRCGRLVRVLPEWSLPARPVRALATRRPLPPEVRAWLDGMTESVAAAASRRETGIVLER